MPRGDKSELKQKALAVLDRLSRIQRDGQGAIAMEDLLKLFGPLPSEELARHLRARGAIELQFADGKQGVFRNSGPAFWAKYGPGELGMPAELAGTITVDGNSAVLVFDPAKTMVAKALLVELKLQQIEVSDHHAALRLPGGMFDHEIAF